MFTIDSRQVFPWLGRLAAAVLMALATIPLGAQGQPSTSVDLSQALATSTVADAPVLLTFHNRLVTTLRATILSRQPTERATASMSLIRSLVDQGVTGPVATREFQGLIFVTIGGHDVFAILPLDVDPLSGETQAGKAAAAAANLQRAIDEAMEMRTPRRMLVNGSLALGGTLLAGFLLVLLVRVHRGLSARLLTRAERTLQQLSAGDARIFKASRAPQLVRYAVRLSFLLAALLLLYSWLTFVLRRFPYTRPWGESLRTFLIDRLSTIALQIATAMPDLFTVVVILVIARFAVGIAKAVFQAAEEGRVAMPYVYPETAAPTRRLVTTLMWLLGIIVAYPYLPGSDSDAFKGVSVFVGLVVSLGSSGIVNQMMSGLTITYSRAVRAGDFVRIGEVEGTVTHLGALSTKVRTPRGEEVTIPNALVLSHVTTNYSRLAGTEGVYVPTSVTIGYDVPWRQVHALLLLAAERTAGISSQPKPAVIQSALQDFYVHYTLLVGLEQPPQRARVLSGLHANIQDAFNEFGVQIMSPNYEADPERTKIVPPAHWYAAPAKPPEAP